MKVLKVLGVVFGVIVLGVCIAYFALLSPPSAESVCNNVARITKKETGLDLPEKVKTDCLQKAQKAPEFGRYPWVEQLKCMRDAETSAALTQCGRASSR